MKRGVKKQTGGSGTIRIIAGQWRGRKLPVLDVQGLRPTTDRNKETLFNWLMHGVQNSVCLDVFAGSGGLGFEALSRYANQAHFVEKDKGAFQQLLHNRGLLKLDDSQAIIHHGEMQKVLPTLSCQFNLVFVDPPFGYGLVDTTIATLEQHQLIAPDGYIYIECETTAANYSVPPSWRCIKDKSSSAVCARLYQKIE